MIMKLEFNHKGQDYTLAKHPVIARRLKLGQITPDQAANYPWYLRREIQGKERKFKLLAKDKDAIKMAKDTIDGHLKRPAEFSQFLAHRDARQSITIGALAKDWIAAGLPFRKTEPRTPEAAAIVLENLNRALPWWSSKHVATIDATLIEDYAGHRAPALRGADLELAALSCLCKWAAFSGTVDKNPFEKRPRFGKTKQHCHEACPEDDETLHRIIAYMFDPIRDGNHPNILTQSRLAGGTLAFCALTGLRPGEPALLRRLPPLGETPMNTRTLEPGTIFPDRAGQQRMKVERLKRGQNPFVTLHPAVISFLSAWRAWLAKTMPDAENLFPLGTHNQTTLNAALTRASEALKLPHFKPHAMRAYYVKVRRSQGEDDASIAGELGQTTQGDLIRSVYGDPQDLHGGQLFDWLPAKGEPAWALLNQQATPEKPAIPPTRKPKADPAPAPVVKILVPAIQLN